MSPTRLILYILTKTKRKTFIDKFKNLKRGSSEVHRKVVPESRITKAVEESSDDLPKAPSNKSDGCRPNVVFPSSGIINP